MEEFSFPIIVTDQWPDDSSRLPLFRSFPASFCFHSPEADPAGNLRRSFSEGGADNVAASWKRTPRSPVLSDCGGDEYEGVLECEERMDMLWEDLNEELFRVDDDDGVEEKGSRRRRSVGMKALRLAAEGGDPITKKEHRLLLVPAFVEEPSNRSLRRRKPGLVAMLRILKKLFIAQKMKPKQQK